MSIWADIEAAICAALGNAFSIQSHIPVAGGSTNDAFRLTGNGETLFVKLSRARQASTFASEAAALGELALAHRLRVPTPICHGRASDGAFLVTEYIDMQAPNRSAMSTLGEGLAELHGITHERFGWQRDNAIGSTLQRNAQTHDWVEFWRVNRLGYQLELAAADGALELAHAGDVLLTRLDDLLAGHQPEASLLHGDLWGGNIGMDTDGRPVLFDPAVYYGDRETDLAMAELFGGFAPVFFEAYHGVWPLDIAYRDFRRPLYQLYHLLNHHHLFGGHYGARARRTIDTLLAII